MKAWQYIQAMPSPVLTNSGQSWGKKGHFHERGQRPQQSPPAEGEGGGAEFHMCQAWGRGGGGGGEGGVGVGEGDCRGGLTWYAAE